MKLLLSLATAALCIAPPALSAQTTHTVQMAPASGVLTKSLDAKKAKQGDPVEVKLDKDVKLDGGTAIPKNSILMGKIDQVQPSANKGESTIQVTFDKVQMKDGKDMPVKATVMQIARPANVMGLAQQGNNPDSAGPMPTAGGPPAGSKPSNVGASGPSGPVMGQGPTGPQGSATSGNMPTQVKDESGYHGVTLRSDIHDSNSGTFTDPKKNVHLSSGTRLDLAIAPMQSDSANQ